MINLVRKIVAGPKNRTVDEQFDLDLTYITSNIIAMAFPASGLEKAYRNSIHDVARFLRLKHGPSHYLIVNASNRKYDYKEFDDQVVEFFWTDHQAPPLTTMFQLCQRVNDFLTQTQEHVVAVHCNHGKGRTGTAIIAYLLFSGQFATVKEALKFYNETRFQEGKLAVDQPCQLRYINYFKSFLQLPMNVLDQPLKAYKVKKITQKGLDKEKQLYVRISETRTEHEIYPAVALAEQQVKFIRPLMGDIFIELFEQTWKGSKRLLRINFHLFFLVKNNQAGSQEVVFLGNEIKMKHAPKDFELMIEFEEYCHCHEAKHKKKECLCVVKREREQAYWDYMVKIIGKNRKALQRMNGKNGKNEGEKIQQPKSPLFQEFEYDKLSDSHDQQ